MPSAVWTGKQWVDENEVEYPASGPEGIKKCPRRVGIVPTSRATFGCPDAELLKTLEFECIIVDEAHNARRKNLGEDRDAEKPDANNLLAFLYEMSTSHKEHATCNRNSGSAATCGSLGFAGHAESWQRSRPRRRMEPVEKARSSTAACHGRDSSPEDDIEKWQWIRTPLPPRAEHIDFDVLRRSLECRTIKSPPTEVTGTV